MSHSAPFPPSWKGKEQPNLAWIYIQPRRGWTLPQVQSAVAEMQSAADDLEMDLVVELDELTGDAFIIGNEADVRRFSDALDEAAANRRQESSW